MCTIAFFSVHLSVYLSLDTLPGLKRTAWGPHRRTVFGVTLRGEKSIVDVVDKWRLSGGNALRRPVP